jgi:hypothetical protein
MGTMKKKEMPMWAKTGHQKPVTRREFLAAGLIPFAASVMLPSTLSLLAAPAEAWAEGVACPLGSVLPALVTINCYGGGAMGSNYIPRDKNMALLSKYDKMGFPTPLNEGDMVTQFGINRFHKDCGFIAGLNATGGAINEALAKSSFVGMCVQSADDTMANKFDISGLAYRAGLVGSIVPNLGTVGVGTGTGIRQTPSTLAPPPPLIVGSFNDLANATGYTRALKDKLGNTEQGNKLRQSLSKLVSNLSTSQTRRLASMNNAAQFKTLVDCATNKNISLIAAGASVMDPLGDAAYGASLGAIFGVNSGTSLSNVNRVNLSMVYGALLGYTGSVNIELGGFDYHDGTRSTGDALDAKLGRLVGCILLSAHTMNKPVFIYVTSDGAVGSTPGQTAWVADRGNAGLSYLIMYDPAGRRETGNAQVGHFNDGNGQAAEEGTPVGADPERAGQAAFANYCRFAARDKWETMYRSSVVRGSGLDDNQLASILRVI